MQNASGEQGKRLATEFSLPIKRERCASDNGAISLPFSDHGRPQTLLCLPSPNLDAIACLVAIFSRRFEGSGAISISNSSMHKNVTCTLIPHATSLK